MQIKLKIVWAVLVLFSFSCHKSKNSTNQSTNPNSVSVNVNVYVYKNTPEFFPLQVAGGWIYHSGGASGLIIYRIAQNETNGDFVAFERNCPHEGGTNTNAAVKVQADNITAKDTICGSKFYITDGSIINGPSVYPLKQYTASYDGSTLHIYN